MCSYGGGRNPERIGVKRLSLRISRFPLKTGTGKGKSLLIPPVFPGELNHGFQILRFHFIGGASGAQDITTAFSHYIDEFFAVVLDVLYRTHCDEAVFNL
jgi:hypothetical protein